MQPAPHALTVARACLPEIMLAADVAVALGVSVRTASAMIRSGALGPHARIGRRLILRRPAFLAAIQAHEQPSHTAPRTPSIRPAP